MSSTADNSDQFTLENDTLENLYDQAGSLHYLSEGASAKDTIYSQLKRDCNRYQVLAEIGQGGVKKILEVNDKATDRNVAMALLKENENIHHVENFLCEARVTAHLQHPNIMPVYDIGLTSEDAPYFTMKLVKSGYNLQELINNLRKKPDYKGFKEVNNRLELFIKVCDAVAYAHSHGIIHQDLKPANIQLDDFGQVLVSDWGLARFHSNADETTGDLVTIETSSMDFMNLTLNGMIKGTPGYMAPEQSAQPPLPKDYRTDIYSLGALLYALLSYHSPIRTSSVPKMLKDTATGKTIPLKKWQSKKHDIPGSLIKVTERAMAVNPDERYQNVKALQDEIYFYINGFATSAEKASIFKKLKLFYQRQRTKINIIALSLTLIISISSFLMINLREKENKVKKLEKISQLSEEQVIQKNLELERERAEKLHFAKISAIVETEEAIKLYQRHKYIEAYKKLGEAIQYNKKIFSAWTYMGCLALTGQRFYKAKFYFTTALKQRAPKEDRERVVNLLKIANKYHKIIDKSTQRLTEEQIKNIIADLNKAGYDKTAEHFQYRYQKKLYYSWTELIKLIPNFKNQRFIY